MALYAFDREEEFISAREAKPRQTYWCIGCSMPVRKRRGKYGFYHFYHLLKSPQCRLFTYKQDHFLAQIQIQKFFPENVIQIEKPFIQINRVADACFEEKKIVFEIQCSPISESEAKQRIFDYRSLGYEVIWLLDDKRYNKRILKPAEKFLRNYLTYFVSIQRGLTSEIYDQFEIFLDNKRVKKGKRLKIDLKKIYKHSEEGFGSFVIPSQIRRLNCRKFSFKDRTYIAKLKQVNTLRYWRKLEIQYAKRPSRVLLWLKKHLLAPYKKALTKYLTQAH